jgi:hypothetical protein
MNSKALFGPPILRLRLRCTERSYKWVITFREVLLASCCQDFFFCLRWPGDIKVVLAANNTYHIVVGNISGTYTYRSQIVILIE